MESHFGSRGRKKQTLWNLFFQYANIGYAITSGIIMVPLYLLYLPLEVYGAWLASGNVLAWLAMANPGISAVLLQRCSDAYGRRDQKALVAYVNSGLLFAAITSLIVLLAAWLLSMNLSKWVNLTDPVSAAELKGAFLLAAIGISLVFFYFAIEAMAKGIQASASIGLISTLGDVGSLLITLLLLVLGWGLYSLAWGYLFRGVFCLIAGSMYMVWRFTVEEIFYCWDGSRLRELTSIFSFTTFGRLGRTVVQQMDGFLIARFLGPEAVPLFVLTRRGMTVAHSLLVRPGIAISPALSHLRATGNPGKVRAVVVRLLRFTTWAVILSVFGFMAFNEAFVRLWVGPELFAGSLISILFCFWLFLSASTLVFEILSMALGNLKGTAVAVFCQALVTLPLMIGGAYYFGLVGVAVAPLFGYLAVSGWYFPLSCFHLGGLLKEDFWMLGREALVAILGGIFLLFIFWYSDPRTWLAFAGKALLFSAGHGLFLALFSKVAREELTAGLKVFRARWILKLSERT